MTWSDFYLICFALGFILSLLSFLGSAHLHLPHIDFHIGGHAHAPHAGGGAGEITPINFGTVSAFLAWFGGAGYLLTRFYSFWFLIAFGLACLSGLVGAALIFFFLAKVLIQKDEELNPADYDMVGVLGTVSSGIRPSGTGELIFLQAGTRRATPARSEDGLEIDKGTEVVVTRYERGIAYVRPWEELTNSPVLSEQK
ncbi:MAG TPA: NfeD family protein [Candidatus Acidoferrales bacterium]|jgi:membrane protein implicated in regulation of membrane protease activity|nr:NfeD family protein [Candidatus Acidoferrales bacterium]